MAAIALLEILIVVVIYFNLPFSSRGVPWECDFDWSLFNYTPVVTGGVVIAVGLWWLLSAKNWFTGPRHTVAEIDAEIGGRRRRSPSRRSPERARPDVQRCRRLDGERAMSATLTVLEPATEAVLAEVPRAGVEEADAAVAAARAALPAWRALAPGARAALLRELAEVARRARRGAGGARGAQRRQADRRRARRDGDGRRDLPLLRGRARAAARRHDPRRGRAGVHLPRAGRRRRR